MDGPCGSWPEGEGRSYVATLCDLGRCGRGAGCSCNVGSDVNVMVEDVIDFMHDMNSISPAQEAFAQALLDEEYDASFAIEHLMGEATAALASFGR